MAFQSFSEFRWLHLQPGWHNGLDQEIIDDRHLQTEAQRIVEKASMRWNGIAPYEYRRLVRLRGEVREGRRGEG